MRQGGVLSYLAGDHLGSTSLTLNASGTKTGEMKYYPYGETRYSWGSVPTDRRYTGQRQEDSAALGSLYDYGARAYSPYLNRWISPDTIVPDPKNPQSLNRYSYVNNSPLKYIDPSGHCAQDKAQDWECWLQYGITLGDLDLNYEPQGLNTWGKNDLANLSAWIASGVKFIGGGWTGGGLDAARTALNRARTAVGSGMRAALGLVNGTLTFNNNGNVDMQTDQGHNEIYGILPSTADPGEIDRFVHELGHIFDWQIRPAWAINGWSNVDPNWLSSSGWWRDAEHDLWRITQEGSQGAPTWYAQTNPGEDFAETFTWYVDEKNGVNYPAFLHPKASSWVNRQDALQVALDQLP